MKFEFWLIALTTVSVWSPAPGWAKEELGACQKPVYQRASAAALGATTDQMVMDVQITEPGPKGDSTRTFLAVVFLKHPLDRGDEVEARQERFFIQAKSTPTSCIVLNVEPANALRWFCQRSGDPSRLFLRITPTWSRKMKELRFTSDFDRVLLQELCSADEGDEASDYHCAKGGVSWHFDWLNESQDNGSSTPGFAGTLSANGWKTGDVWRHLGDWSCARQ